MNPMDFRVEVAENEEQFRMRTLRHWRATRRAYYKGPSASSGETNLLLPFFVIIYNFRVEMDIFKSNFQIKTSLLQGKLQTFQDD